MALQALKDDALGYIINDPRGKPTPAQNIAEEPERSTVYYGFSCYACLPSGAIRSGCWTCESRGPAHRSYCSMLWQAEHAR